MTIRRYNLFAAALSFLVALRIDNVWWYYAMAIFFALNVAYTFDKKETWAIWKMKDPDSCCSGGCDCRKSKKAKA